MAPPGGRILNLRNHFHRASGPLKVGLVLLASGFMLAGMTYLVPHLPVRELENGQGGPREPILDMASLPAPDLSLLRDPDSGSGPDWGRDESPLTGMLPTCDRLGPLYRPDLGPVQMTIGRRETFYDALVAMGAPHEDIMALVKACKSFRNLSKVRAGEVFRVHLDGDGGLRSLGFDLDEESHVTWVRSGDTFERVDGVYPVQRRLQGVAGSIKVSLYASLQDLDAPLALAAKMNDILGWDIDFKRDLRQGDTFRILYQEVWKDGTLVRTGAIEALEIVNKGRIRHAFHFAGPDGRPGYFDDEGKNLQKQLIRAPLEYSRISSGFSYRRFHPVLKKWMPHLGVDYAAPLGTSVRAAGDGVVVAATRKEGNGRFIQIRHNNSEYETFYLHLSRFAEGIKQGVKVRQGDVIGFVGATGYATGPHLDYRVKRNGKFVNPRELKLPAAHPVSQESLADFQDLTARYGAELAALAPGDVREVAPLGIAGSTLQPEPVVASVGLPEWVRASP